MVLVFLKLYYFVYCIYFQQQCLDKLVVNKGSIQPIATCGISAKEQWPQFGVVGSLVSRYWAGIGSKLV